MKPAQWLMRGTSLAILSAVLVWIAWTITPVPLLIGLGVAAALYALHVGEAGEARYGRRVPVTEMLPLGRQGDRQMLYGGIAGYLMIACFALAAWWAFHA